MSLMSRLQKASSIKESAVLSESDFFENREAIATPVAAMNIALSGRIDKGFSSGITMFAGPSKHFKTAFLLLMVRSYLKKYKDSVVIFYDSEFGSPKSYFESFGIDPSRVLHIPIPDIETLKHDISLKLDEIKRGDKVIIALDSIGNLASKKEIEDALDGKSVADMTRAKQLKSLFRIITSKLTILDIPMVVVAHVYQELGLYPKAIVSGGTGSYYGADNIFIVGRRQQKEDDEVVGYDFVLNVEKSRFVREKSQIPISVTFEGGIDRFSGLFDLATEAGFLTSPTKGWYSFVDHETGEVLDKKYRKAAIPKEEWTTLLANPKFQAWVVEQYQISNVQMITDDEIAEELDHVEV